MIQILWLEDGDHDLKLRKRVTSLRLAIICKLSARQPLAGPAGSSAEEAAPSGARVRR
jgi:predicted alpha/beta-hydrolase family hydrolase